MTRSSVRCLLFVLALAGAAAAPAVAADADGASLFVQAGGGDEAARAVSIGVAWGLPWRDLAGGLTTRVEVFASQWRTPTVEGGHRALVQVGVVPTVRVRFDGGRSPWFLDGGIGLALLDGDLSTPERTFSTRLNFSDNVGIGRSFGLQRRQELSLQLQHTSNAGVRKPNPGLDLLMLRYAHRF